KHTFFEESVKVPLIMRLPDVLPAGETRDHVVNLVDLSQTMLDAMDVPQLAHADGRSFWPVAIDASQPWENETFSEYCTDAVPAWTGGRAVQQRMIRSKNWKLTIFDREPPLLFDLETDPQELNNRANDPECAKILQKLTERVLENWTPETIAARMQERRIDKDLLAAWGQKVQPEESHIWKFSTDMNRLDDV
ncbi:DUF4976 domain-containing protein, partial [bacterium]|nr:DUF4976 domain-containing protein [bacterium]